MYRLLLLVATLTLGLSTAGADDTKDRVTKDRAKEIYYQIYSPYCPGRALADCPTEQATKLKDRIINELEAGKSKDAILGGLYSEFGDRIRAVPAAEGFGLLVWVIPILIIVIGAFVVIRNIKAGGPDED